MPEKLLSYICFQKHILIKESKENKCGSKMMINQVDWGLKILMSSQPYWLVLSKQSVPTPFFLNSSHFSTICIIFPAIKDMNRHSFPAQT